jgi:hypothetical protein
VVAAVADLAGIESEVVPQPVNLELAAGRNMDGLLDPDLPLIPGAGTSRGASLLFNPGYDLNDPGERANQVNEFLREMAMDAGLLGMEARLDEIRRRSVS